MDIHSKRGIFTCANDNFVESLKGFLISAQKFNPDLPICVIPFDNNHEKIERLCKEFKVHFWDQHVDFFDHIGAKIFGNRNHRPNAKKKNYFRKLASFLGPFEQFIFLDVSIRILSDITKVFSIYEHSEYDILFYSRSLPFRNFHNDALIEVLEVLNSDIRRGFAAGCFVSRAGVVKRSDLETISNPSEKLVPLLGGAPEQSFLNYFCGVTATKCERIIHFDKSFPMSLTPDLIEKRDEGEFYRKFGKVDAGKKLYFALVRERDTPEGHKDYWLIEEFKNAQ